MILLAIAAVILLGCDKPKDNRSELGEPTTVEAIQRAQNAAVSSLNPNSVKLGETSHMVETQEIVTTQGPLNSLVSEWVTRVQLIEELPEAVLLTITRDFIDHTDPDKPKYEFQDVLGFEKTKDVSQTKAEDLSLSMRLFSSDTPAQKSESIQITNVTFHNLINQKVTVTPPPLVRDSTDCRGLSPCSITADQINYDIVFYMSDGTTAKHQVEWLISPQVPFFSAVLKQCASTIIPVDNVRVLVKQCQQVVDFTF